MPAWAPSTDTSAHWPTRPARSGWRHPTPEEFEGRDLRAAVFWGVDLGGASFRDVDLSDVTISHARVVDVDIDGYVDRVRINGVDVTQYVNDRDLWHPLRTAVYAEGPDDMRAAWDALDQQWAATIEQAGPLSEGQLHESVGGEWSFVETLRHLVFAIDKWFTAPILGAGFHPIGMPNSGSVDFGWPGLDHAARPTLDETLAVRAERSAALRDYLGRLTADELTREVAVLENGTASVRECLRTVFEEEFEHNRYATRDLGHLRVAMQSP